ncbi:ab-hydrolase associated lipase region family protein [Stylonychia lemnae]|uniref:Lipase n=1 Tax=Stylonychia lemnae TaxID=5949 RepID=A0A078AK19_STYLE|nr:ab-hydrolase associated lipase region family protein [Stylonychia lemnae]|eukprot:CDW82246.1 ab-hydrolase associated lipase region family protein [Stylonychia lemnae]
MRANNPDVYKSFKQITEDNGFVFEEHVITTDDQYILKLFRIPGQKESMIKDHYDPNLGLEKPVVFLQHGLFDSADAWIMNHASQAPAFVLARAGYDVWLGNNRGNKYSLTSHIPKTSKQFWDYGFEEMGDHDLPAALNYIEKVTYQRKVAYIGHSQGTSQLFYALSRNESYFEDRISLFIALGPVMRVTHEKSSIMHFLSSNFTRKAVEDVCDLFGIYELFPSNYLTTHTMDFLCDTIPKICDFSLYLITDEDLTEDDESRIQVYLGHFPSGSSLRTLNHYAQMRAEGQFERFDFGKQENLKRYGQEEPPIIDLTQIQKVPIALFVGAKDELADNIDNRWAKNQLQSLIHYSEYSLGHMSFFVAKDASYFTQDVMRLLNQYHPANQTQNFKGTQFFN